MGIVWENSLNVFLLVTVVLGGGAAYMTGRAVALTWRPLSYLVLYIAALTCAVRFIHYALFSGTLLSPQYFIVDFIVLIVIGGAGLRITRSGQMSTQYAWLYARRTPLAWKKRA